MTHIDVNKGSIIGSNNGVSPYRYQAIIWTNAGILLIVPLGTNFSEFLIEIMYSIHENALENAVWKMAAILSQPQCVKRHLQSKLAEYILQKFFRKLFML